MQKKKKTFSRSICSAYEWESNPEKKTPGQNCWLFNVEMKQICYRYSVCSTLVWHKWVRGKNNRRAEPLRQLFFWNRLCHRKLNVEWLKFLHANFYLNRIRIYVLHCKHFHAWFYFWYDSRYVWVGCVCHTIKLLAFWKCVWFSGGFFIFSVFVLCFRLFSPNRFEMISFFCREFSFYVWRLFRYF